MANRHLPSIWPLLQAQRLPLSKLLLLLPTVAGTHLDHKTRSDGNAYISATYEFSFEEMRSRNGAITSQHNSPFLPDGHAMPSEVPTLSLEHNIFF